jgi:aromatic ring-opening dioxygenase catalytic subunit (LigB family)
MLRLRGQAEKDPELSAIYDAWEELRASLEASKPDVIVAVASDHFHAHSFDLMPVFTIGRGDSYRTWGEFGTRQIEIAGHAELSDILHEGLVAADFDVAGSVEMRLDHAWACPLEFLDPDNTIPIVPLSVNGFIGPLASMGRCRALGERVGALVAEQMAAERVAIVGTGGISHWIGLPETGTIGEEFDRHFLDLFESGAVQELDALDDATIVDGGGPGAGELRCWMTVLGATGSNGARRLVYAPAASLYTGIGLLEVTR